MLNYGKADYMLTLLKNSWSDFKESYLQYILFEFIYSLFASILFAPFLSYIFNRMLTVIDDGSLLNSEVFSLGLSISGIMGTLFVSFFAVAFLFVEFGVLIILAEKSYFNKQVYISEAFLTAVKKLPRLLGFGFIPLVFILLLFIPFIDASTLPPLFDVNITIFLTDLLYESLIAKVVYFSLFLGMGYLFVRWIFALHYIFIENKSIWQALRCSWNCTKKNKIRVVWYVLFVNILIFLAGFVLMNAVSELTTIIDSKVIGDFIGNYLLTFASYFTMLMSLVFIPVNLLVLTRLFYQFQERKGVQIKDSLKLGRSNHLLQVEKKVGRFLSRRKSFFISTTVVVLSLLFAINYVVNDSLVYLKWDVEIASHRGDLKHAPENSMSSIRSAIRKGVDAVEVDVAMTKDGVIVLSHDLDLKRVAGVSDKISNLTYEEIKQIDIGRLYGEEFIGERIPTLDEVLKVMQENDTKLIIDLKSAEPGRGFAEKIVKLVEKNDSDHLAYVQSFSYELLQDIRKRNETIKIGQILFLSAGNLSKLDVDFYTIRESMLTERFIERAKKQNREVWVWTVNIKRNMKEVLKYDIDGIITDYPERAQRVLEIGLEGQRRN
ncbi:glycerophosphodiester phosphodiesterase [Virgibacillus halodenitrificans]|uniref:glycerophosphodiester phosphodiesterase n=1 Tax=Virgibacillus halodenitrificans TaxID=1482 RepID=UPI002DB7028B|nr:glycerophosphodiester phosphodiesterase [Virgibacillus halodenitrificans]MEC2158694.1 glycerophosphodiester phosphodiesterase [Virgibacillus halodenitrificans]